MSRSPYNGIERRAFWKIAVEKRIEVASSDIFRPKFPLMNDMRIATAGSCFAQHVGRALRQSGSSVIDAEPAPPGTPENLAKDYGYSTYSARYGNIYTVAHLLQIMKEATGRFTPAEPVWALKDRFVDSQRANVEPTGLETPEAVIWHRARHLACIVKMMQSCDVFVFTFGLTEAWLHTETQTVFSLAPGTLGGSFDPTVHSFKNYTTRNVVDDFREFMRLALTLNPNMKFLITVSPIPLAATASGTHVEIATTRSKAVLRAACDELASNFANVDYFPSYEIINSPRSKGQFFAPNLRDVTPEGVQTVMTILKRAYGYEDRMGATVLSEAEMPLTDDDMDARCEEVLLNQFADIEVAKA